MRREFLTTMTAVYEILGIPCFISGIPKPSLLNGHFWPFNSLNFGILYVGVYGRIWEGIPCLIINSKNQAF